MHLWVIRVKVIRNGTAWMMIKNVKFFLLLEIAMPKGIKLTEKEKEQLVYDIG